MNVTTELSIVVPTLNEEGNLRELLASLALQQEVQLEVIVADGGSGDATCVTAAEAELPLTLVKGSAGMAQQLNRGALAAKGEFLLFLHADSRFADRLALRRALDALASGAAAADGSMPAGHFALRFRTESGRLSFGYRYLQSKARLERRGCSHGDQGILLSAELFRAYGGFDENRPLLAATGLADRLRESGQWLLLPAELSTSARRFEREGLRNRQIMNAVIMTLGAAGRDEMLALPGLYRPQGESSRLRLQPLLKSIDQAVSALAEKEQQEFWRKVGRYICENAWQAAFGVDVMLAGSPDGPVAEGSCRLLQIYDRWLSRFLANTLAARLAALAARSWFKHMAGR